jgi:hypothetical protein
MIQPYLYYFWITEIEVNFFVIIVAFIFLVCLAAMGLRVDNLPIKNSIFNYYLKLLDIERLNQYKNSCWIHMST